MTTVNAIRNFNKFHMCLYLQTPTSYGTCLEVFREEIYLFLLKQILYAIPYIIDMKIVNSFRQFGSLLAENLSFFMDFLRYHHRIIEQVPYTRKKKGNYFKEKISPFSKDNIVEAVIIK